MTTNEGIHSVVHTIRILEQFQNGEGLSASDLAQRVGIPRATVHRILKTLVLHQILRQDNDKKYRLTLRLMKLGNAALSTPSLQQLVNPLLNSLVDATQETAHFSVLDGYQVGYVAKQESPHQFRMLSYVGWRGPLHATASGKVLLSFSDEELIHSVLEKPLEAYTDHTITDPLTLRQEIQGIRTNKYAEEDEELSDGLTCIAVPVVLTNRQIGALSVSGPKHRMKQLDKAKIVDLLHQMSDEITKKLHG